MKLKTFFLLLSFSVGLFNQASSQVLSDFTLGGLPKTNGFIASFKITVITNVAYVVGYDEIRKDPVWVAYKLVKKQPSFNFPRPPSVYYKDDKTLSKVPKNAYSVNGPDPLAGNTSWDHGHMAANNPIMRVFGKDAQLATFRMSNMCPQSHRLNAGKWNTLEEKEYDYSQTYGELWTVCGPIFDKHIRTLKYGIEVPNGYYKILVRKDGTKLKAIAIRFEYFPASGGNSSAYLKDHLISIADVERLAGLDFFSGLPNNVERELEDSKADDIW